VSEAKTRRRLAAILCADVVDYTKHTTRDERGTIEKLRALREAVHLLAKDHDGRIVDAVGDNFMAEFASVLNATLFAMAATQQLRDEHENDDHALVLRIGIHVGDILEDQEQRLYGDVVNLAARVMAVGDPGAICISSAAQIHLAPRAELPTRFLGEYEVKNFARPVGVHCIEPEMRSPTPRGWARRRPDDGSLCFEVVYRDCSKFRFLVQGPLLQDYRRQRGTRRTLCGRRQCTAGG